MPMRSDRKDEIKQTVARQIKAIRERRQRESGGDYSQAAVAQRLADLRGVSITRVGYSKYETGENEVAATDLPLLAEIFNVPVDYFYDMDTPEAYQDDEFTAWYRCLPRNEKMTFQAWKEAIERRRADDADDNIHGQTSGKKAQ